MNIHLAHAAEVVGGAVDELVANGTTRERLLRASQVLLGITPREFDQFPDLKVEWEDLHARLSAVHDPDIGSYRKTVEGMSAPAMKSLCALILGFERSIRSTP